MRFSLTRHNSQSLFEVRPQGDLILKRAITKEDAKHMHKLIIKASDCGETKQLFKLTAVEIYIVQNFRTPTKVARTVESNLIVIISMIAVTLVISLFLIAAIVFLRSAPCTKIRLTTSRQGICQAATAKRRTAGKIIHVHPRKCIWKLCSSLNRFRLRRSEIFRQIITIQDQPTNYSDCKRGKELFDQPLTDLSLTWPER